MHYLGFDCHRQEHSWTLLDATGQPIERGAVANNAAALRKLRARLPEPLWVGLEGPRDLRREVERRFVGCACSEISPAWTHAIRQRSPLPDKDDLTDADRAALALLTYADRLVPLQVDDEQLEALRALVSINRSTAHKLVAVRQRTHRYLGLLWNDAYTRAFPGGVKGTARRFFAAYPHPWNASKARQLAARLRTWSWGRMGEEVANRIKRLTKEAEAPTMPEQIWIDELREALVEQDQLAQKQTDLKARMESMLHAMNCGWLLEQPGLGPVRAAELIAGGLLASPGPSSFARHCGIAPESQSTGASQRHRNARRRHKALFNTMMGWAAGVLGPRAECPQSVAYFERKKSEGKSPQTALRCLPRRLIDRLFKLRREHQCRSAEAHSEPTHQEAHAPYASHHPHHHHGRPADATPPHTQQPDGADNDQLYWAR